MTEEGGEKPHPYNPCPSKTGLASVAAVGGRGREGRHRKAFCGMAIPAFFVMTGYIPARENIRQSPVMNLCDWWDHEKIFG